MESEKADGQAQIQIRVHPDVGPVDEQALVEDFLQMLGASGSVDRIMEAYWRQSGIVSVDRSPPTATRSAKTLHLRSE